MDESRAQKKKKERREEVRASVKSNLHRMFSG